jgi:hypothetical protein
VVIRAGAFGLVVLAAVSAAPAQAETTRESSAQTTQRPRIMVYPRRLPASARRHCRAWLVQEYRVSGTVIVPRMRCRWE